MAFWRNGLAVALVCAVAAVAWPSEPVYQRKSLSPQHMRDLQNSIHECAARVNSARDPEERSGYQEQLCIALIQAEDYDRAIRVAQAIHETPNINEERRAVAHFLVAQVYHMKMEASPSLPLMEENRRLALQATAAVIAAGYPDKWMVNDSARRLQRSLQDPAAVREAQARVVKRQSGGLVTPTVRTGAQPGSDDYRLAPAQRGNAQVSFSRATPGMDGGSGAVTITRDDFARLNRGQSGSPDASAPVAQPGAHGNVERAVRNARLLSEPIVIDGTGVRRPRPKSDTEKVAEAAAGAVSQ